VVRIRLGIRVGQVRCIRKSTTPTKNRACRR
jgi:hypothetical protein